MDIATVDDLLTTTRSVRKRLDARRPVEPEVLERCIEIACQAPTGSNAQGWHFVVLTDAEKRACVADSYRRGCGFDLLTQRCRSRTSREAASSPPDGFQPVIARTGTRGGLAADERARNHRTDGDRARTDSWR